MIAEVEVQDAVSISRETLEPWSIAQDAELIHVGGGQSGCLF
jgi:hypothetical protein